MRQQQKRVVVLLLLELFFFVEGIRSLKCYISLLPYEINDDLTLDNLPSFANNQLVDASGSCTLNVEWLRNPRSSFLVFGYTTDISADSVVAGVRYQLAGEAFLQRLSRKIEYVCRSSDGCNSEDNLRRLLRSIRLTETFSPQFDSLLVADPSFSNQSIRSCNEQRTSTEICPPRDDLNCQRCEIIVDWRNVSKSEICATCPGASSDVNSIVRAKTFLLNNRSLSVDHLQLWCQTGEQCNSFDNVQLIRQASVIDLDFDKFFDKPSHASFFSPSSMVIFLLLFFFIYWEKEEIDCTSGKISRRSIDGWANVPVQKLINRPETKIDHLIERRKHSVDEQFNCESNRREISPQNNIGNVQTNSSNEIRPRDDEREAGRTTNGTKIQMKWVTKHQKGRETTNDLNESKCWTTTIECRTTEMNMNTKIVTVKQRSTRLGRRGEVVIDIVNRPRQVGHLYIFTGWLIELISSRRWSTHFSREAKKVYSSDIARIERERENSTRLQKETERWMSNRYLCSEISPKVVAFDNWNRVEGSFERSLSIHIRRIDSCSTILRCRACESDVSESYSTRHS